MKWLLSLALLCASSTYAFPAASPRSSSPIVTVKNGTIAGLHSSTYNQDMFLGVSFAQPPVGELRFRNPQSIKKKFGSTIQATEYAPECVGYGVRLLNVRGLVRWTVAAILRFQTIISGFTQPFLGTKERVLRRRVV
jgi:hypothetical protein